MSGRVFGGSYNQAKGEIRSRAVLCHPQESF